MFKVSGLWVSPADVEARLIEHPAVLEAAVVGVPVEGFTKGKAYVTVRDPDRVGPRARRRSSASSAPPSSTAIRCPS